MRSLYWSISALTAADEPLDGSSIICLRLGGSSFNTSFFSLRHIRVERMTRFSSSILLAPVKSQPNPLFLASQNFIAYFQNEGHAFGSRIWSNGHRFAGRFDIGVPVSMPLRLALSANDALVRLLLALCKYCPSSHRIMS